MAEICIFILLFLVNYFLVQTDGQQAMQKSPLCISSRAQVGAKSNFFWLRKYITTHKMAKMYLYNSVKLATTVCHGAPNLCHGLILDLQPGQSGASNLGQTSRQDENAL